MNDITQQCVVCGSTEPHAPNSLMCRSFSNDWLVSETARAEARPMRELAQRLIGAYLLSIPVGELDIEILKEASRLRLDLPAEAHFLICEESEIQEG